jgi:DUF971 family protein
MRLMDFQIVGTELALKWDDGQEGYIPLEVLRRQCPCAGCKGEVDVMGNVYRGPDVPLTNASFRLEKVVPVGGYALQPIWADGHTTGLYSFEYLRALGQGGGAV